jgi:hypothetical protein
MKTQAQPTEHDLKMAHHFLRTSVPLEEMLTNTALAIILKNVAMRHMQRRAKLDVKKLQANDVD